MATLSEWLARQERVHARGIDLGLERVARVARALGLDRPRWPVITVAGTNGKGSTVALLDSMLRAAGLRVGAFTSPHLVRYNERVRVGGRGATDEELIRAFERIEDARGPVTLTFFEYSTLAALEVFTERDVDVAVLEVGLGGRLDATNLLDADVGAVVSIGFDHREWLGDTLEAIGREKAGIFRAGRPAVIGEAVASSVYDTARALGAHPVVARRDFDWTPAGARWSWHGTHIALEDLPRPALAGIIQFANAAVALAALEALAGRRPGEPFDRALAQDNVATALESVKLPGRFQIVPGEVEWILDVAHNEPAALVLAAHLAAHRPRARTIAVAGFLADKDVPAIARALQGAFASWVLCSLPGPRGLEAGATAARLGLNASVPVHLASSVPAGLNLARSLARAGDRIVVFGSFLTVGPALEWLGSVPETPEL